jgi:hypothetical protein
VTADWVKLARSSDVTATDDGLHVAMGERSHLVSVIDDGDSFRLVATVAGPAAVARMGEPVLFAWKRNRSSRLVGFRIDHRGRMIGEAWLPKHGLTAAEFQVCLRAVATESDRLEQLLTGRDAE